MNFTFNHIKGILRVEKKKINFRDLEILLKEVAPDIYSGCVELDHSECEDEYREESFFSLYCFEKRCKSDESIIKFIYNFF